MRKVSGKFVEKIAAHILCSITNFQNRNIYGIMWKKYCRAVKGKSIPLQAWRGPGGSRRLRLPDFKTIGT
jgi:hypothetical protein